MRRILRFGSLHHSGALHHFGVRLLDPLSSVPAALRWLAGNVALVCIAAFFWGLTLGHESPDVVLIAAAALTGGALAFVPDPLAAVGGRLRPEAYAQPALPVAPRARALAGACAALLAALPLPLALGLVLPGGHVLHVLSAAACLLPLACCWSLCCRAGPGRRAGELLIWPLLLVGLRWWIEAPLPWLLSVAALSGVVMALGERRPLPRLTLSLLSQAPLIRPPVPDPLRRDLVRGALYCLLAAPAIVVGSVLGGGLLGTLRGHHLLAAAPQIFCFGVAACPLILGLHPFGAGLAVASAGGRDWGGPAFTDAAGLLPVSRRRLVGALYLHGLATLLAAVAAALVVALSLRLAVVLPQGLLGAALGGLAVTGGTVAQLVPSRRIRWALQTLIFGSVVSWLLCVGMFARSFRGWAPPAEFTSAQLTALAIGATLCLLAAVLPLPFALTPVRPARRRLS